MKVIDKLLLFFCCTAAFLALPEFSRAIVPVLISVIFSALLTYLEGKKACVFLTASFLILSIFLPPLVLFLPAILYDTLFSSYRFLSFFAIVPLVLFFRSTSLTAVIFTVILLVLGLWLCYRTDTLEKSKAERNTLRDNAKELSMKLKHQNDELLQQQDISINVATLNERNRIAREIHDSVGHLLSSSLLQVGALLAVSKDESIRSSLTALKETLNKAMNGIRTSVHDLFDESIDLYGQLRELTKDFSFCNLDFHYELDTDPGRKLKYAILAIVKEALTNVIRHSNATHAAVLLHEHPAFYQLIISDNGTVKSYDSGNGIGLQNIRDRVNSFHGVTNITAKNGFRIFITIPKREAES